MTIVTLREGYLLFKVAIEVAGHAGHLLVFSEQRIFGLGVIEVVAGQHVLPASGGVTDVAGLLKFALVRIDVAVVALRKLHVFVARGSARSVGLVALFAGYFAMQACEWIACLGMVEILSRFPAFDVMALGAIIAELALVWIVVAGRASRREPEVGLGQVFILDERFVGREHFGGRMAFVAGQRCMLAFEFITGKFVIEFLRGRVPVDQMEAFTVMFEVTAHAIFAIGIGHLQVRVIAVLLRQGFCNFLVAVEAAKGWRARTELMASGALRSAVQ